MNSRGDPEVYRRLYRATALAVPLRGTSHKSFSSGAKRCRSAVPRLSLQSEPDLSARPAWVPSGMDKKQINDPKMTANFLIWVGGVFMLLLFALLAHFVWGVF